MAVQRAAEVRPQIILMDLHMADRSGIDVAREIKQVAGLQDVPIIATSATPPDSAALSPLFTSVLQKPYSSAELLALLAAALPR
jgi:CheY-like chemotaxis protein